MDSAVAEDAGRSSGCWLGDPCVASAVAEEAGRSSGCWLGDPCAALGFPGGCYSSDLGSTQILWGAGGGWSRSATLKLGCVLE